MDGARQDAFRINFQCGLRSRVQKNLILLLLVAQRGIISQFILGV